MPFSPPDLANLKAWWKASSLVLSDGDPVATWTDSSGNGFDVTQGTAGFRPTYQTAELNGKPVVRFDGSDDVLRKTMTGNLFAPTDDATFFFVAKSSATGDSGGLVAQDEGPGPTQKWFVRLNSTEKLEWHVRENPSGDFIFSVATTAVSVGVFFAYALAISGATQTWHRNGIIDGSDTDATPVDFPTLTEDLTVGLSEIAGLLGFWNGDIAEIIIYNRALTAQERNQVGNYLESEYGLTWSDEFKDVVQVGPDGSTVTSNPFVFRDVKVVGTDTQTIVTPPPPEILSVVYFSPTSIRVSYTTPMLNNGALVNPLNYTLVADVGSVSLGVVSVTPEVTDCVNPNYVDLTLSGEMTTGTLNYNLQISNVKNLFDVEIVAPDDNKDFNGQGFSPGAIRVQVLSLTEIEVFFSESVKQVSALNPDDSLNPGNYLISGSSVVTVSSVMSVNSSQVKLTVTGMTNPGSYLLTLQNIRDLANNLITP